MKTHIEPVVRHAGSVSATAGAIAETYDQRHQEWLLDEALAETFPASDPISPGLFT